MEPRLNLNNEYPSPEAAAKEIEGFKHESEYALHLLVLTSKTFNHCHC